MHFLKPFTMNSASFPSVLRVFRASLSFFLFFFILSCSEDDASSLSSSDSGGPGAAGSGGGSANDQTGIITAGEWNDLENWDFWNNLLNGQSGLSSTADYWEFYPDHRLSFRVMDDNEPIVDLALELYRNGALVWEAKSDNQGRAEMWTGLFQSQDSISIGDYSLKVNGQDVNTPLQLFQNGVNEINLSLSPDPINRVELSFIVDATGSMGDELEFLKDDLKDVLKRVQTNNTALDIYTSSVFYRDKGDDYLIRKSDFSGNAQTTIDFIGQQQARGGGDFPEAVHTALQTGIEELTWTSQARTRIAFLLLDAPPHYSSSILEDLKRSVREAAKKGIKIIPITASGINRDTELLMRLFAIATNGTYVFITDDSGVGNDHLEPNVGPYEVEKLNDLMVRLIKKYSD